MIYLRRSASFCKKHGFPTKDVINEIKKNKYFRPVFSKDPAKQKIHENIAAKYIKGLPAVKSFVQLNHKEMVILKGQ